jgi:hypothetical protein
MAWAINRADMTKHAYFGSQLYRIACMDVRAACRNVMYYGNVDYSYTSAGFGSTKSLQLRAPIFLRTQLN